MPVDDIISGLAMGKNSGISVLSISKMFSVWFGSSSSLDLLVSDTWLDTGIGYWYRYPMTRYYERLLDTRSS